MEQTIILILELDVQEWRRMMLNWECREQYIVLKTLHSEQNLTVFEMKCMETSLLVVLAIMTLSL